MLNDLINILILGSGFLLIFGIGELLFHFLKVKAEYTRKWTHIATGLLTMAFPIWLQSHYSVLLLCGSFAMLLYLSLKYKFLKSINAVQRQTNGSLLYPAIVYLCFLIYVYFQSLIFFYVPILVMAIADPVAALAGRLLQKGAYKVGNETKTLSGSIAFFIVAFFVCFVLFGALTSINIETRILASLIIAVATAFSEAFSQKGYDNFFIPLTASVILIMFRKLALL